MKIKLAILEHDLNYLNRVVASLGAKFADKVELYSFTELEIAMENIKSNRIDVFIADSTFEIDIQQIPAKCAFAYLVETVGLDSVKGVSAIFKYQKVDLIYKQVLGLYSEKVSRECGLKIGDQETKIIAVCSPCGGVGSSSIAAAAAAYLAQKGKKTLYLNLEKFGSADIFFNSVGQFDMSDIVFALKSINVNLSLKLESCVKQDQTGVFFYSQAKSPLDIYELTDDDIDRLISEIDLAGRYDYLVLDLDFTISNHMLTLFDNVHTLVWVSDGSEIANEKICKAYEALNIIAQEKNSSILNRLALVYNKFSNKTGKALEGLNVKNIGGAPCYRYATAKSVVEQLSNMEMFHNIL